MHNWMSSYELSSLIEKWVLSTYVRMNCFDIVKMFENQPNGLSISIKFLVFFKIAFVNVVLF